MGGKPTQPTNVGVQKIQNVLFHLHQLKVGVISTHQKISASIVKLTLIAEQPKKMLGYVGVMRIQDVIKLLFFDIF